MLNGHQKRKIITVIREILDEPRDPIHNAEHARDLLARADEIAARRDRK